jgi:hypothetical protein
MAVKTRDRVSIVSSEVRMDQGRGAEVGKESVGKIDGWVARQNVYFESSLSVRVR